MQLFTTYFGYMQISFQTYVRIANFITAVLLLYDYLGQLIFYLQDETRLQQFVWAVDLNERIENKDSLCCHGSRRQRSSWGGSSLQVDDGNPGNRSYTVIARIIVDGVRHLVTKGSCCSSPLLKEVGLKADGNNELLVEAGVFLSEVELFFSKKQGCRRELG